MAIRYDEIEKLTGLLAAYAKLKLDYKLYINSKRKLLIVEGITDQVFVDKIQGENVDCIVAAKVFGSNAQFRTSSSENISSNCKNAIVKIITGISYYPSPFVAYPDDLDKWNLYGLVDLDCEEISHCKPSQRLFVTDTHDLETLMLSTDDDLLTRLETCKISRDEVNKAYFLAYQLAIFRKLLGEYHEVLSLRIISCGSRQVAFSIFVKDYRINIRDLINYINNESGGAISALKIKKMIDSISNGKSGRKVIDAHGNWKQQLDEFVASMPSNFWNIVNGHDILQLLLYICPDAFLAFNDSQGYFLNRAFEMSLIATYNYSQFEKTILQNKMFQAGLIG